MSAEESVSNAIRGTGEYYDEESGFYYLRGRYYDPSVRRFTTPDPAEDGINHYAYCGNNPIDCRDPSGYAYARTEETWGDDIVVTKYYSGEDLLQLWNTESLGDIVWSSVASVVRKRFPVVFWSFAPALFLQKCVDAGIGGKAKEAYETHQGLKIELTITKDDYLPPMPFTAEEVEDMEAKATPAASGFYVG